MKKKFIAVLSAMLLTMPGLVSCGEVRVPGTDNNPDSGENNPGGDDNNPGGGENNPDHGGETDPNKPNPEQPEKSQLELLKEEFNCIDIKEAEDKANAAGEAGTTELFVIAGEIEKIINAEWGNLVVKDTTASLFAYGPKGWKTLSEKPEVGDLIVLKGKLQTHKNKEGKESPQIFEPEIIKIIKKGTEVDPEPDKPNPDQDKVTIDSLKKQYGCIDVKVAEEKATTAGEAGTNELFLIAGEIEKMVNAEWGNLVVKDSTASLFAYGLQGWKQLDNKPVVGDVVVLKGKLQTHKNKEGKESPQIFEPEIVKIVKASEIGQNPNPNPDPTPNPDTPTPDVSKHYYEATFNVPNPEDENYSISNEELMNFTTESKNMIEAIDVQHCYKDGGLKFSSSKVGGSLSITFKENIQISNINLVCEQYHGKESPEVSVKVGNKDLKINSVQTGDNFLSFNALETNTIQISAKPKARFILNKIILNGDGTSDNGEGEVDPDINPEIKEPATASVNVNGEGSAILSKTEGLSGDECVVNVTHDTEHYVVSVIANGTKIYRYDGQYKFKLEPGANLVTVEIGYLVPGAGHPELFESPDAMNYGTRGDQGSIDEYYASCRGLKGAELKAELQRICRVQHYWGYKHNDTSFKYTDFNPDDPSKLVLTYTGEQVPVNNYGISVNKEHSWPNSRGAGKNGPGEDKHMIRPTENQINSLRSNYDFGVVEHTHKNDCAQFRSQNVGNYRDTSTKRFEPKDSYKGDSARMIFYLATIYPQMELARPNNTGTFNYWTSTYSLGDFDDMYAWATDPGLDPVSKLEMSRNNQVDIRYQHNRNPFIDHPEFVEMIYSKSYSGPGALLD